MARLRPRPQGMHGGTVCRGGARMNFFAHQQRARRDTWRMLGLFAMAVLVVVAATDFVLVIAVAEGGIRPQGLLGLSLLVAGVIALGSLYRTAKLRSGGAAVAAGLGAVLVPGDTGNFAYQRLRNVVEEMAIASGVPVPHVFVLEQEAGINAFAAGYTPADAAITVTRGALDKLTRAELQGVIGHEFSHILNGDMRLNIRLIGVVFGILVIAMTGRLVAESARHSRNKGGSLVMLGLALYAIGYIGVILARAIKASISRQREYLADASAVQFTRQTDGIAGALKKIGALAEGSQLAANANTEEVAHMLFGDGVGYSDAFATHPPLGERIRRLDPSFRSDELDAIAAAWAEPQVVDDAGDRDDVSVAGLAPRDLSAQAMPAGARRVPAASARMRVSPRAVAAQVGNPDSDDRAAAHDLHATLPPPLRAAARDVDRAIALVLVLLLGDDAALRSRRLQVITTRLGAATAAATNRLTDALAGLHPMQRLPLAALAFPTLRRRPRPQLDAFVATLHELITLDGEVTLGDYCLATLVRVQVIDALSPAATFVRGRQRLPRLAAEVRDVLAVLAQYGNADASDAREAFLLGLHEVLPAARADYRPPQDWIRALDHALPQLDRLAPAGKELLVQGLTRAISSDGIVTVVEAELLRTICAALHCPLPPLLQEAD